MTRGERKSLWLGLAFISPWIVGVLVFTLGPCIRSRFEAWKGRPR